MGTRLNFGSRCPQSPEKLLEKIAVAEARVPLLTWYF